MLHVPGVGGEREKDVQESRSLPCGGWSSADGRWEQVTQQSLARAGGKGSAGPGGLHGGGEP